MPRNRTKPKRLTDVEMRAFATAICRKRGVGVDCGTFLEAVIDHFGGLKRLAHDFVTEYQNAKVGSMQRQRMMELISRLMIYETSRRAANPTPVGQMDDEDLDLVIQGYLARMPHANGQAAPDRPPGPAAAEEAVPDEDYTDGPPLAPGRRGRGPGRPRG